MTDLPKKFDDWFSGHGWRPYEHQLEMALVANRGQSALLIAPTGGGKTMAGFLPSLIDLDKHGAGNGLHTLYISPLKALASDIHRNLEIPVDQMGLEVTIGKRTGDTNSYQRKKQRKSPPDILLTTPESLAILLSYDDADEIFGSLNTAIIDETHVIANNKRGELLSLGLTRLKRFSPDLRFVGLSATVEDPQKLAEFIDLSDQAPAIVTADSAPPPEIEILCDDDTNLPWSGHMGTYAVRQIYERIRQHQSTIVFVNTRTQVELVFKELWRVNDDALPIALHHGSLSPEKRRVVEDRMAKGDLRAVVATSSLDLGLDWGAIDLVIQLGAPKGVSRLLQRIGRANHRLDDPSKAILVPANRFQMLECRAAVEAIAEDDLDGAPVYDGGYDVAAQHIWGVACHGPFDPDELYREMTGAAPFKNLKREIFNDLIQFVASGGYALSNYERFQRIIRRDDGKYHLADKKSARQYRLNVGTIVSAQMMKVKLNKRRTLGSVEEYFVSNLTPGDRFMFAGQTLTFQGVRDNDVFVTKGGGGEPSVPNYIGGRMPLSTHLATRVRRHLADPESWGGQFAKPVADWLVKQTERSVMPAHDGLLVETFPRGGPDNERHFMVAYPFAGRNAHQTLGMLLTRRMERFGLNPLGFSATDYAISIWGLTPADDHIHDLFDPDILGDDLEEWMEESPMLRRTFRSVALVSGLIQERHPGKQKTGRQVTMNTDLIYDVLRDHEPGHILLKATRKQAAKGLTDIRRLNDLLTEVQGKITHHHLDRASPLSIPILMEAGREKVDSPDSEEALLREAGLIN